MEQRDPRYGEPKFYGIYRALVKDVNDPKKLGRLKLQVPEVFGLNLFTDWATPKNGSISGNDKGDFFIPDLDDGVWAEFEAGDTCRPVWSGRWWAEPGSKSEVPQLARGIADDSQKAPKGTDVMLVASEPSISFAAVYPNNRVYKSKKGIVIELDDTDGATRVHIWHPAKTWIEIHNDGTMVQGVSASRYSVIEVNDRLHVIGNYDVQVDSAASLTIGGHYDLQVAGDLDITVGGDMNIDVAGAITRQAGVSITDNAPVIQQNP